MRAIPPRRRRSIAARLAGVGQTPLRRRTATLRDVTERTEAALVRRVPAILDERLRVLSRRQPVTVPPGTSLADCLRAIQRTGTGDSVFVCDASGRLSACSTERDIFGRIVAGHVDLSQPVESLMTTEPRTLDLDQTIRDAIELMQTGRYRNVPLVDERRPPRRRRPPGRHHQVPGRVVPRGAAQPPAAAAPAHEGGGRRVTTTTRSPSATIEELERVTIRFAGDSGDGMQLTGTQFTRTAAVFGNDISTLPDFPAEIRAPAGSLPGVSGLPDQLQLERHPHAGRPARRPGRDEPGRAQDEHRRPAAPAARSSSTATRSRQQNLNKAAYATNPLTDGSLQRRHGLRDPDLDAQRALARWARHDEQAEGPDEELLRARAHVLALRAEHGADDRRGSTRSSRRARWSPRRTSGRSRPATRSARRPRSSTRTTGSSRRTCRPGRIGTSPATRRPRSGSWRRRSWPSARSSTAATRSRRPATSSTSSRATRRSGSRRSRPRTRSRPSARPSARATAGRSG